jgi:hypothetical protein
MTANLKCPRCHSTRVRTAPRGFDVWSGSIGSSRIAFNCLDCGCEFGPGGQQELLILSEHFKRTVVVIAVLWGLPFALLLLVWLFNVL